MGSNDVRIVEADSGLMYMKILYLGCSINHKIGIATWCIKKDLEITHIFY